MWLFIIYHLFYFYFIFIFISLVNGLQLASHVLKECVCNEKDVC